jgi:Double zinc ribbon
MLAPAVFGISNSGINLAIDLLILFLVVIWLALVYWTYADARRRISDPWIIGSATVASLFPFVGTLVYLIVRPPEYLDDVRERELEIQAAEARLAELGYHLCPHCDFEVEKDFLRCPNCMRKLKDPCPVCSKPLDPNWRICPFCEAEVGSAAPAPRRTRRRRDGTAERPAASAYPEPGRSVSDGRASGAPRPVAGATRRTERGSTAPPRERSGPPSA